MGLGRLEVLGLRGRVKRHGVYGRNHLQAEAQVRQKKRDVRYSYQN